MAAILCQQNIENISLSVIKGETGPAAVQSGLNLIKHEAKFITVRLVTHDKIIYYTLQCDWLLMSKCFGVLHPLNEGG